ncbi:MAG: protein kinase domain-containing protein [Kofleriaceae bacterium]
MVATATARNFGKYSLVAKLATGGMAEIFLARLQGAAGFEKLVCIKRILPHLAKDQTLVGMFLAEARIAAQISHPNVCQVFELGEIDGRYFIAMEYLEGVPLSCFRRPDIYAAPPDPRLVAALGIQACEGLHHAHQLKRPDGSLLEVVHRDVSSNNLFATVDGVVKVLDFGIAKVQDASVRTSTGSMKGTYAYMAPEQLRGELVDRRTDVFAMGIVLWEMFARTHLFKRETDFLTFQAITTDPIPDVRELRPDVPPELAAAIAKALSRPRDDRFPTARALGEALARSVAALGGPLTQGELSDELARGFAYRIAEQQALIRIAREGGGLELEEDLGPGVVQGTALAPTPVSGSGVTPSAQSGTGPRSGPVANAIARSGLSITVEPVVVAAPPPPTSPIATAAPAAAPRSRAPVIAMGLLAVGAVGAAVFFYAKSRQSVAQLAPAEEQRVVMASSAPPLDAAVAYGEAPVDASIAISVAPPIDASVAPPIDAGAPVVAATLPDSHPRKVEPRVRVASTAEPKSARPAGPPGYITIDAKPYAVIFIDGKRHGETPLVQLKLPPGKHVVRAVSRSGASRTFSISIESGKVAPTRRIEW